MLSWFPEIPTSSKRSLAKSSPSTETSGCSKWHARYAKRDPRPERESAARSDRANATLGMKPVWEKYESRYSMRSLCNTPGQIAMSWELAARAGNGPTTSTRLRTDYVLRCYCRAHYSNDRGTGGKSKRAAADSKSSFSARRMSAARAAAPRDRSTPRGAPTIAVAVRSHSRARARRNRTRSLSAFAAP
jgi:hypothetical protein